jgi:hypothetical protein
MKTSEPRFTGFKDLQDVGAENVQPQQTNRGNNMRNNLTTVRAYCIRPLFAAILALALAFTLSCSGGDDGGGDPGSSSDGNGGGTEISSSSGGNGGDGNSSSSGGGGNVNGTLTITGIPSQYNGKYAFFATDKGTPTLIGLQSFDATTNTVTLNQISNGSVSIPMWLSSNGSLSTYSGNHTVTPYNNVAFVEIRNTSTFIGDSWATDAADFMIFPSITFSNGGSALSWTNGGGSGSIPADLQGTWKSVNPGITVTLNANSVVVEQVSNGQTIRITQAVSACIPETIADGEWTSAYSLVQKVTAIEPNGVNAGTTVGAFSLKPAIKFNTAKDRMVYANLIFTQPQQTTETQQ